MAERATGPLRPSERPSAQQGGEKDGKPKGGLWTVLLLLGLIVLSLSSGLVAAKIVVGQGAAPKPRPAPAKELGAKVLLDEFLVNLAGPDGHYLKTTLAIGLVKGITEESIKDDVPVIRDSILSVLTGKELTDVSSTERREKLKEELRDRVNRALGGEKVLRIYFTEFMTQ